MVAEASGEVRPGAVVAGRYRIEALLGRGGFGAVFRATQLPVAGEHWAGVQGREVAIKVLHPNVLADAQGLERFRREAMLLQRLQHPNIVRLYDFGETDARVPFIVFELLPGRSLDVVVREDGPLPEARVARITTQVLKALMEAHALGIVHRDIKPANVLVADLAGERDFVKVLDFGVAKATRAASLVELTRLGQIVGTPHYMAPELVLGNVATPAVDLYALGLTMIRVMTGAPLFTGGIEDVIREQVSPAPIALPPVVERSALARVIRRATQKDLALRYASAQEMHADLERAQGAIDAPTQPRVVQPVGFVALPATSPVSVSPAPPQTPYAVASMRAPSAVVIAAPRPVTAVAPARRTPVVLIAVLGALALVAILGVGVVVGLQLGNDAPSKPAPSTTHAAHTSKPDDDSSPTDDPKQDPEDSAPTADIAKVRTRLEAEGWKILVQNNFVSPGTREGAALAATKSGVEVSFVVTVFDDTAAAKRFLVSLGSGYLAFRGRRTTVHVNPTSLNDSTPAKMGLEPLMKRLVAAP